MSVAHDLNALEELNRKDAARELVTKAAQRLSMLRQRSRQIEAGDAIAWEDVRVFANELVRAGTSLELGLLVACAKEILHFTARKAGEPNVVLYLLSGLDTLAMELERLRHDKDLR